MKGRNLNPLTNEDICRSLAPIFKELDFTRKRQTFSRILGEIDQSLCLFRYSRLEDSFRVRWELLLTHRASGQGVSVTWGIETADNLITPTTTLEDVVEYERRWLPLNVLPVLEFTRDLDSILNIPSDLRGRFVFVTKFCR